MAGRINRWSGFAATVVLAVLSAVGAALAGGCAPRGPSPQARQGAAPRATVRPLPPQKRPATPAAAARTPGAADDACAARLHDLSGLRLLYFVTNHRLPEKLEDLAPLADPDMEFGTTCPASGQPYVYVPAGLPRSGSSRVLLVYDAVPAHGGIRNVIVASPPQGDQPLATWVMPFTEERFRRHVQPGNSPR